MEEFGKILPRVLKTHTGGERPPVLEMLAPLWLRVAGRAMAEQSRPVAFTDGTLTLATPNRCWATELRALRNEVRSAINRALGRNVVKHVRVVLASQIPALNPVGAESADHSRTESVPNAVDAASAIVNTLGLPATLDAETRALIGRSYAKYFRGGKVN